MLNQIESLLEEFYDEGKKSFDDLDKDDKDNIVAALIRKEPDYEIAWSLSDSDNIKEIMLKFASILDQDPSDKYDNIDDMILLMSKSCSKCYENKINDLLSNFYSFYDNVEVPYKNPFIYNKKSRK